MKKTRVDVEHVLEIQKQRLAINKLNFDEIEWYKDGKKLEIDKQTLDDFEFTGLNNTDFIISNSYKQKNGMFTSEPEFVGKIPERKTIPVRQVDEKV